MKRQFLAFASAALLTASLSVLNAGQKHGSRDDAMLLRDVADEAHSIANISGQLQTLSPAADELRATYLADFAATRDDINTAGKELRRLESERASLEPWEQQALDQVEPLFVSLAKNGTKLIEIYNEHRPYLQDPNYKQLVNQVRADSSQAARLLDNYFKLEKARKSEQRALTVLSKQGD